MAGSTTPLGCVHLATVLGSVFFFSGVLFGWAPLQSLLLRERGGRGQFSELCGGGGSSNNTFNLHRGGHHGGHPHCEAQLQALELVYTLSTFTLSFVSLPGGWFVDVCGVRATVALACTLEVAGLVLFSQADSIAFNWFIPAACLMSAGGFLVMCASWPAAFLYSHWQTIILASISCLFDASSIVPAIFETLGDNVGREKLFLAYACWAFFLHALMFCLWSCVSSNSENNNDDGGGGGGGGGGGRGTKQEGEDDTQLQNPHLDGGPATKQSNTTADMTAPQPPRLRPLPRPLQERSLAQQLCTFQFAFAVVFSSIQQLRANAYIGMNNNILHRYHDDDGRYTEIFGWFLPAGVVFIPVIDIVVERLGLVGALHATNVLGICFGALVLFNHPLEVQLGSFFFFAAFRAFLYSVMSTFNAQVFGLRTLGRITGCVFTSSAVFQLLQYPLTDLIEITFNGDPFWPCLGLVLLILPITALLLILHKGGYVPGNATSTDSSVSIGSPQHYSVNRQDMTADGADPMSTGGTPNLSSPLLVRKRVSSSPPMDDLDLNLVEKNPSNNSLTEAFLVGSPTHLRTPSSYSNLKV